MRKFNGIAVLSEGGGVVALSREGVVADAARLLQTFVAEGPPGACYKPGKKTHSHMLSCLSIHLCLGGGRRPLHLARPQTQACVCEFRDKYPDS